MPAGHSKRSNIINKKEPVLAGALFYFPELVFQADKSVP
jgi:hypothetical protein